MHLEFRLKIQLDLTKDGKIFAVDYIRNDKKVL